MYILNKSTRDWMCVSSHWTDVAMFIVFTLTDEHKRCLLHIIHMTPHANLHLLTECASGCDEKKHSSSLFRHRNLKNLSKETWADGKILSRREKLFPKKWQFRTSHCKPSKLTQFNQNISTKIAIHLWQNNVGIEKCTRIAILVKTHRFCEWFDGSAHMGITPHGCHCMTPNTARKSIHVSNSFRLVNYFTTEKKYDFKQVFAIRVNWNI